MRAKPGRLEAAAANDRSVRPTLAGLALKLALVTVLAATTGARQRAPAQISCLLLESLYTALTGISVARALLSHRGKDRPAVYGYWHEAMALGGAALLSHLALSLLR
jgi:hypothetical protein